QVYPASKFASNPAFISIIIFQLFSCLLAYRLRQRLKPGHTRNESANLATESKVTNPLAAEADRKLLESPPIITERTTELLDAVQTGRSGHTPVRDTNKMRE